ncbi:MAG: 30S ribosomal protein S20 [candidate division WOR-3 bacterium]
MAKKKLSVLKRVRQNEKRRLRNRWHKIRIKNTFKKLLKEKNEEKRKEFLNLLYKYVDKAVKEGVIHENKGARIKSKAAKVLTVK